MADKKLNNVSTLTSSTLASSDYAYVEDVSASNEQKKVLISDLAKVVGGLEVTETAITSNYTAHIGGGQTVTSATIPKGDKQAILICTINGPVQTPSVFLLGRKSIAYTVFEGNSVPASNVSIDSNGDITITKSSGVTLYYRLIFLER